MAVKFSAFTTRIGTLDTSTKIVGYDNASGLANVQFSLATLQANSGIYVIDGTIGTTRKALITDTVQFRNAGDTSDIFTLNTDGTFALGLGASSTDYRGVAIGAGATASSTFDICIGTGTASGGNSIAIGRSSSSGADAIAMGNGASSGANGIAMGQSAAATGNGVAIGYDTDAPDSSIGLGANAKGTGANSIILNANGSEVNPSTANAFGVYMSSNTAADFEVVAGGESRLNSNLRVSGQGYSALHTVTSAASITPDWNNSNVQTFELTSASTTIVNPSNIKPGATYILILKQDSTGGRTVSFGTQYNFPADTAPTLTTTANKADVITLVAYSSTVLMCTSVLDFTTT